MEQEVIKLDNFTRIRNPFTGELLTDENTIYIDAEMGDDLNSGTRAAPKKSSANINQGNKIYVLKGRFTETLRCTVAGSVWVIGEPNTLVDDVYFKGATIYSVAFLEIGKLRSDFSANGLTET
ncbi:MAG: hypothetical protein LBM08_03820, partial [Dysgonamonadaceae bacterium]|nr:hypothetical protein [Dysgonamonadaceae bacterium]